MTIDRVTYLNQPNCYRLSNGTVEAIITTDTGPRIIRYGFSGEENILGEVPATMLETTLGVWKPWGGHRLWTAPEAMPRSYAPDNAPIHFEIEDGNYSIRLTQPADEQTGIEKEMIVKLEAEGSRLTVHHQLTNRNLWGIELAPWAITIMQGGGEVILPQEPYRSWNEELLPARPLVLWHYTDLSDPRWAIGKKYLRLRTDASMEEPQKIGILNKQGWAAYHRGQTLFVKRFTYLEGATYPDYGSNNEAYTAGSYIELETLAPLQYLAPDESAEHVEHWQLFNNVNTGSTEETLNSTLNSILLQTTS